MKPDEQLGTDEPEEGEEAVELDVVEEEDPIDSTWEWDGSGWRRIE